MQTEVQVLRGRHARRAPVALISAAYALLVAAWIGGNPPGASPDEQAHYVRALGLASGQLRGTPAVYTDQELPIAVQRDWINRTARTFTLPARLAPPGDLACYRFKPRQTADCHLDLELPGPSVQRSHEGTFQPFLYLPAGLLARLGNDPLAGFLLGRLGSGAVAIFLIALAAATLCSDGCGFWPMAGLMAAITPMVVFLGASLSPNGPEVAAGICFFAAMLRLGRTATVGRGPWVALTLSGVVLATSRPLGPAFLALQVGCGVAAIGPRVFADRFRKGGALAIFAAIAAAAACLAGGAWELAYQPHPSLAVPTGRAFVRLAASWPWWLQQQIGVFGWLDTRMPMAAYAAWTGLLIALIGTAIMVGTRRQRRLLLAALAGLGLLAVGLGFLSLGTGFPLQGRHILGLSIIVPLFAAEAVSAGEHRLRKGTTFRLGVAIVTLVPAVQAIAWYVNERRYAVGIGGPVGFLGHSRWAPWAGWWPWGGLMLAGVCTLLVGGVLALSRDLRSRRAAGL